MKTPVLFDRISRPWELRWLMVGAVGVLTGLSVAPHVSRAMSYSFDAASARIDAAPVPEDEFTLALASLSAAGGGSGAGSKAANTAGPRALTADPFHLLSMTTQDDQSDAADRGAAAKDPAPRARTSHRGRPGPAKKAKKSAARAPGPVLYPKEIMIGMGNALLNPESPLRADEAAHSPHFVPPDDPNPTKKPTDPGVKLPAVISDAIAAGGIPIYQPDKERRDVGIVVRPAWPFGVTVGGKFH